VALEVNEAIFKALLHSMTRATNIETMEIILLSFWVYVHIGVSIFASVDSLRVHIIFLLIKLIFIYLFCLYNFFVVYEIQLNPKNYNTT
jgi:hypothetical protein